MSQLNFLQELIGERYLRGGGGGGMEEQPLSLLIFWRITLLQTRPAWSTEHFHTVNDKLAWIEAMGVVAIL